MSYSPEVVRDALVRINNAAPQAVMLQTDLRYVPTRGTSSLGAKIYKATKHQQIDLYEGGALNAGAIKSIGVFFGLPETQATDLYLATSQIAELNARGTWCLSPANEPTVDPVTSHRRFPSELVKTLADNLPTAGVIQADIYSQPTPMGHNRRRVFLRVYDTAGAELAALDTSHFAVHIQAVGMGTGKHVEQNIERAGFWAGQLGIDLEDIPFVLHDLSGLFSQGGLQRVDLRTGQVA